MEFCHVGDLRKSLEPKTPRLKKKVTRFVAIPQNDKTWHKLGQKDRKNEKIACFD